VAVAAMAGDAAATKPGLGDRMVKGYCRDCSYSLDQLTENQCPECGRKFEPESPNTWDPTPEARRRRRRRAVFDAIQWGFFTLFVLGFFQLFFQQALRQILDWQSETSPDDPMMTQTLEWGWKGQNISVFIFCLSLLLSIILGWIMGRRVMND
jgi:methionyl-tRNA synthetase